MYKRQDGDVVLARFVITGDENSEFKNSGDIRFIKRRGKFYRVNDLTIYKFDRKNNQRFKILEHKKDISVTEITQEKIIELINAAFNATMNWTGEGETYEIWINDLICRDLGKF